MQESQWKGSVFPVGNRLKIAVKIGKKWKQIKTPYKVGQEEEAKLLLKRTREMILAGADAQLGHDPTVAEYSRKWLPQRKQQIASWEDDESRLKHHILPAIGAQRVADVRARHVATMMAGIREKGLAPRTVRNIYAVTQAMFRDAMIAGLADQQPCILTYHQLGKVRDKKHEWRSTALFTREELLALMSDPRVPHDRRIVYALESLGRLRHGEAAGLRWRHIEHMKPLNRIVVATSYDHGTTKARNERWMPMHPLLARLIAEWKLSGWPREFGRSPEPNDLVVPHTRPKNRGPRVEFGGMRSDHDTYKRLRIDCDVLGLRRRRGHDLCRTGITLYREAGADKDKLHLCTHGSSQGDVMEAYTSFGWPSLCEEIQKLRFVRRFVRPSGKSAKERRN